MSYFSNPRDYEAWYQSRRGKWIGDIEYDLLLKMLRPTPGSTLLDVGCGTGYFSRRFAIDGLKVVGLDSDQAMLAYARSLDRNIRYIQGNALSIPFADNSVDYCVAVASLCFVDHPRKAILEMLRVSKQGTIIGLLNRESRLYQQKFDRGAYRGARWDTIEDVNSWIFEIKHNLTVKFSTAVFFPSGNVGAQIVERFLSNRLRWGSFLSIVLHL